MMYIFLWISLALNAFSAPTTEELNQRLDDLEQRMTQYEAANPLTPTTPAYRMNAITVYPEEVVQEVHSFLDPVDVYGRVAGDVSVIGHDIVVQPGGVVHGDATTLFGTIRVAEGGTVHGNKLQITPSFVNIALNTSVEIGRRLVFFMTSSALGVLLVGLFPGRIENISIWLGTRPVRGIISGTIWTTALTLISLILTLICIGTPLAFVLCSVLGIAWLLGFAAICEVIGHRIRLTEKSYPQWLAFLIGAVIVTITATIPYIGIPLLVLLSLMGIGAAIQTRFGGRALGH